MNVKELKKLASEWLDDLITDADLYQAIMDFHDDPQAEHEDLVGMAREAMQYGNHVSVTNGTEAFKLVDESYFSLTENLSRAVIERFGKREPRKVDLWAAMLKPTFIYDTFTEIEDAQAFIKDNHGRGYWLARLTGTEEV